MELTRKQLYDLVWAEPMSKLCKRYGLSDNGLRKHCKALNIPTPPMGYWAKIAAGHKIGIPPLPADKSAKRLTTNLNEVTPGEEDKIDITPQENRFKVREKEIESGDTSAFIVPAVLYAKDSLIFDTKENYRNTDDNPYIQRNPYKSKIKSTLNLYVSEDSLNRALLIYETIIKALRYRGHNILIRDNQTFAVINNEEIEVRISERKRQDPANKEKHSFRTTSFCGELQFIVELGYRWERHSINDTKHTRLEDKIITIIAFLEIQSEIIKEKRVEAERQAKIRAEEERKRQEFEEQKKKELKEFKALFKMAERLHKTTILRQYIKTYEEFIIDNGEMSDEIRQKIQWANDKADWLDPFISKDDLYLDKFDKDEIIQSDCPKSTSRIYDSYSSSSYYSFWSNPFRRR